MLAAEELLGRPGGDWATAYGAVTCKGCGHVHAERLTECPECGREREAVAAEEAPNPWAAIYAPPGDDTPQRIAALSAVPSRGRLGGGRACDSPGERLGGDAAQRTLGGPEHFGGIAGSAGN